MCRSGFLNLVGAGKGFGAGARERCLSAVILAAHGDLLCLRSEEGGGEGEMRDEDDRSDR